MYKGKDFEEMVILYLNVPGITETIKGNITRFDERSLNTDEDLTVDTLTFTDGDVQRAVVNVTLYIKDIKSPSVDLVESRPNTTRFDLITDKIFDALGNNKGKFWECGNLWIGTPMVSKKFANAKLKEHFITIRVEVKAHILEERTAVLN